MPTTDDDDIDAKQGVAREFMARLQPGSPEYDRLKASIDEAIAELDRTGGTPLDFQEIRRKGRELLANQQTEPQ
jgi:hypothetical protein